MNEWRPLFAPFLTVIPSEFDVGEFVSGMNKNDYLSSMIKWAIAFTFFICFGKSFSQQRLDDFSFIYGDPIQVQLINKTGYNLDTVIYHNLFFPFIEKEDSTGFIAISNYTEGDFISGNVSGFNMDNTHWVYHCIPKKSKYSGKKLIIEMYLADSDMLPGRKRIKTRISKVLN